MTAAAVSSPFPASGPPGGATGRATVPDGCRVTRLGVLRSEWSKLWSLRSTWIALSAAAVLTVGLGVVVALNYVPGDEPPELDPVRFTLLGTQFGQVTIAVLGILVTAGEYGTGTIRATVTAVPRRLPVLWAKAVVFGGVAFAATLATVFLTFPLAQLFLSGTDQSASLGDPGVVRGLAGAATGIALIGVLTLALGSLLRSVAGGVGAYVAGVVVLPEVARMLPFDQVADLVRYFPVSAGTSMSAASPSADTLSPGTALLTLCIWVAAALAAAGVLLARRDV